MYQLFQYRIIVITKMLRDQKKQTTTKDPFMSPKADP